MSYLNANIPPIYCKLRKEYLYDLKKHQGESEECVSSVSHLFQVVQSYLTSCYQMVRAFGVCLSQRFSKNRYDRADVPDMQIARVGTVELVLVIILVLLLLDYLRGKKENI
jgi:hypothetical protein